MPRLVLPNYTVIRDTREKEGYGWIFHPHPKEYRSPRCDGMIVDKLETGDYSLLGYEDIVTIERKAGFFELWNNYNSKNKATFEEEMRRISAYKYAYILIESTFSPDILELSPPQFTKGVPGKALIRWLMSLTIKYGVHIIPVGSCGVGIAKMIFEEVVRREKDKWVAQSQKDNC